MTPRRLACRLIAATWLLFGASLGARADAAHHILWEVKGKHNTIYLLGSVHMLKAVDSELPGVAMHAYAMSQILVMEEALGMSAGHTETRDLVARYLNQYEGTAKSPDGSSPPD